MAVTTDNIKKQIISLLDANERDGSGNRVYSTTSGDNAFLAGEMDRAILLSARDVMQAVCETDGHAARGPFVDYVAVNHDEPLPAHYGTHGIPRITPFEGASFTIKGVLKSVDEIDSYRRNPDVAGLGKLYGDVDHDQPADVAGTIPSPLAGFFEVLLNIFNFTGHSAKIPLAKFVDGDIAKLRDDFEGKILNGAFGYLHKDGTVSDIFSSYASQGKIDLAEIRGNSIDVPSMKPTQGMKDRGTK